MFLKSIQRERHTLTLKLIKMFDYEATVQITKTTAQLRRIKIIQRQIKKDNCTLITMSMKLNVKKKHRENSC